MLREVSDQDKTKASAINTPCRFCGQPASFIDSYLSPFEEDQEIFPESMKLYYCPRESIGFAYPVPSGEDLARYYNKIYRDGRRLCVEDPHKHYTVVKSMSLSESQFMYLSQFIDFSSLRTVIDMGCGHGMLLRRIHQYNPSARLIGIELDPVVSTFLKDINAEFVHTSASASVDIICERISNDTLLVSSHTLHYQDDVAFLRDIIRKTKQMGKRGVHLFIEVPNDIVHDPDYAQSRVYDIPKLIFFTVETFQKGIFDLNTINVSTNGWSLEQEIFYRRKRLEQYERGRKHFDIRGLMLYFGKSFIPIRARMVLKNVISGKGIADEILSYYSYGGTRRAIRMIGRIG